MGSMDKQIETKITILASYTSSDGELYDIYKIHLSMELLRSIETAIVSLPLCISTPSLAYRVDRQTPSLFANSNNNTYNTYPQKSVSIHSILSRDRFRQIYVI